MSIMEPPQVRAKPALGWLCFATGRRLRVWLRTALQQLLTERQKLFPAPICQEAGKANPDEPARQDMEHGAAQELFRGDRHLALLAAVSVVTQPPSLLRSFGLL